MKCITAVVILDLKISREGTNSTRTLGKDVTYVHSESLNRIDFTSLQTQQFPNRKDEERRTERTKTRTRGGKETRLVHLQTQGFPSDTEKPCLLRITSRPPDSSELMGPGTGPKELPKIRLHRRNITPSIESDGLREPVDTDYSTDTHYCQ